MMILPLFNNIEISHMLLKCLLKETLSLKFKNENFVLMLVIIKELGPSMLIGLKKNGVLELMIVLLLVSYRQQKNDLVQKLPVQIQNDINQLPIRNLNMHSRNSF
jgi:hypothetical protein